tara:strand:- start:635 stop:925 length:291 start_codon:yes stop_codon:yes gene_type:complete
MMVLKKLLLLQERRRSARIARALTNPPMASSFVGSGGGDNVGNACTSNAIMPSVVDIFSLLLFDASPSAMVATSTIGNGDENGTFDEDLERIMPLF